MWFSCRANISVLHEFVRSHSTTLPPEEMMQAMAAITECAHILQARKQKDEDIEGIVNMAKALSNAQVKQPSLIRTTRKVHFLQNQIKFKEMAIVTY